MFYFDSKTSKTDCASIIPCTSAYIDRLLFAYADYKSNKRGPRALTHLLMDK
mgnify:CR=1 FL=1